jgi:hypothetical protein
MSQPQTSQPPHFPTFSHRPQLTIILGVTSSSIFPTLRDIEDRWGVSGSAMTEAHRRILEKIGELTTKRRILYTKL